MPTRPVLAGLNLPHSYEYEEEQEFRSVAFEAADGSLSFDVVQADTKHLFTLRWRGLTLAQRDTLEAAYALIADGSGGFTSPTGAPYTVSRDPGQRELQFEAQPTANGVLYWRTELRLREV